MSNPRERAERHLVGDARAANEAWLSGSASGPAELSMYVSNLSDALEALLARVDEAERELRELNERIPRDRDGRPIIGLKIKESDAVVLSNWVEPWIADVAALCARAALSPPAP